MISTQQLESVPTAIDTSTHPYTEAHIGQTELQSNYRVDLRLTATPDVFYDADPVSDWHELTWQKIGKPYRVEKWSNEKLKWEHEHN